MNKSEAEKLISMALAHYFEAESKPLSRFASYDDLSKKISTQLPEEPADFENVKNYCQSILDFSVNTGHKRFSNQLWSANSISSLIGEIFSAVTNTSMYTYEVAPLATLLESTMINYLTSLIWESPKEGIMTSGGSASNLQALLMARNIHFPSSKSKGLYGKKLAIFTSNHSHYSVKRAANLLGLGTEHCFDVPVNSQGQMTLESLVPKIEYAKVQGFYPLSVVATAGTTVYGAYDDLKNIGQYCRNENIWFHVDGAYGANVLLSSTHNSLMAGVELADSLSWDFHKVMGIHLACAFLLTRHRGALKKTLQAGNDSYIFHDNDEGPDLGPSSLQCGRRVDIHKLWLTWLSEGRKGLGHRIDNLFKASQELKNLIYEHPYFELVTEPESINVCFRFKDKNGHTDKNYLPYVRNRLQREGLALLNYSENDQGPFFRMAITRPDLNGRYFSSLLEEIQSIGGEYAKLRI